MEEEAFIVGVPYQLYWGEITPKLFRKYSSAYEMRCKDIDRLNHMLGQYIATGVNNPTKYPKKPFLTEDNTNMTPQDFQQLAKQRYGKKE